MASHVRRSTSKVPSLTPDVKRQTCHVIAAIPCYNTEKYIAEVVAKTKKYVDEVVVIDDGSTDSTADMARLAGAVVLSHSKNRGKGAAMKTAVESTKADIIVFIDGDGQHDPDGIPALLEPIIQGKADFVIGSRYIEGSRLSFNPFVRKAANAIASLVISLVVSVLQPAARFLKRRPGPERLQPETSISNSEHLSDDVFTSYRLLNGKFKWISDCTSGFTAMRMQSWNKLNLISDGFQIETEIIFEQSKNGFIIAETPISCTWEYGFSKLSVVQDGLKTLVLLIRKLIFY
jgi:glycosyltransferase involved in cell wall biosynthesis